MSLDSSQHRPSHLFGVLKLTLGRLGFGRGAPPAGGLNRLQQLPRAASVAVPLEQKADPVGLRGNRKEQKASESGEAAVCGVVTRGFWCREQGGVDIS